MSKVFDLNVAREDFPQRSAKLTLPASRYELRDTLRQLDAYSTDKLYLQIKESYRGEYLVDVLESGITLPELNVIAEKLSEMDEWQEAVLEGLVKLECRKPDSDHLPWQKILQLTENTERCFVVDEAMDDAQLGRFYADNDFIKVLEKVPDEVLRWLDYEKIGREMRLAEGGVFSRCGYVLQREGLRELTEMPDTSYLKPDYTILLELSSIDGSRPTAEVELPGPFGQLERVQALYPADEYTYRCTDCAIPFFRDIINESGAGLDELDHLSRMMDSAQEQGRLPKYKALLLATDCRDIGQAAEIEKDSATMEYRFLPIQRNMGGPEAYALQWLEKELGKGIGAVEDQSLKVIGLRLLEQDNVVETPYGLIQRTDGQPIQRFDLEQTEDFQMQGMGGM